MESSQSILTDVSQSSRAAEAVDPWLLRTVYFGEAIRAVEAFVGNVLLTGSPDSMMDLLRDAFDRLSEVRAEFTPEEYTTFFLARLLDFCQDEDEAARLKRGAMRYMVVSAEALPADYMPMLQEARRLLADAPSKALPPGRPEASSARIARLLAEAQARREASWVKVTAPARKAQSAANRPERARLPQVETSNLLVTGENLRRVHTEPAEAAKAPLRRTAVRPVIRRRSSALGTLVVGCALLAALGLLVLAGAGLVAGDLTSSGGGW